MIVHIVLCNLKPIAWAEPLEILIPWQIWVYLAFHAKRTRSFVRPRQGDVLHCIASATEEHQGNVGGADVLNTFRVPLHGQIEAAKLVSC